jgi:dipeptidyl aminopeptidase/acylaminoacyl peptidase
MGLVRAPELFRCGASYAGVMDLPGMLRDDEWYADGRLMRELVGDPDDDRERLRETSPIENVARIRVPVLLAHGEDDGTVHVHQTQKMAKALQAVGKDVELMIFPDEIHGFKEERNRIEFYTRLVAFFQRNLAPHTPSADGESQPAETSVAPASVDEQT